MVDTVYAETLSEKNHKDGLKVLKGFINNECDVNVTVTALVAILYNLNYYDKEEKRKYINSIFDSLPLHLMMKKIKGVINQIMVTLIILADSYLVYQ